MDPKEFRLRAEAMAGGVEFMLGLMLTAIGMVEQEQGTPDDVAKAAMHMALTAQLSKLIAHEMVDRNDVTTRKQFIDHTAEQLQEFVGRVFEVKDEIAKEIIARNEFSKADPSKEADDVISAMQKKAAEKRSSNSSTQPLQPKPEENQKPADPPVYPEEE
jgi:hypothetical protein